MPLCISPQRRKALHSERFSQAKNYLENWQKDKEIIKTLQTKISQLEFGMVQLSHSFMPAIPAERRALVYWNFQKELFSDDVFEMIRAHDFYDSQKKRW